VRKPLQPPVTETGGSGTPICYLNGAYADQSHWRRAIADLGATIAHITYDEGTGLAPR
jgi:hypothetical protein